MIDDHNRCEWVNVSSSSGSPWLSWTKSREFKMVVCVCVCVLHLCFNVVVCRPQIAMHQQAMDSFSHGRRKRQTYFYGTFFVLAIQLFTG